MTTAPVYGKSKKFDSIYTYKPDYLYGGINFDPQKNTSTTAATLDTYESDTAVTVAMTGTNITAWNLNLLFSKMGNFVSLTVKADSAFTASGGTPNITNSAASAVNAAFCPATGKYTWILAGTVSGTATNFSLALSHDGSVTITDLGGNFSTTASANVLLQTSVTYTL